MSQLEAIVVQAWKNWGSAFALYTECSHCKRMRYCRGRRRSRMLCIFCFDEIS